MEERMTTEAAFKLVLMAANLYRLRESSNNVIPARADEALEQAIEIVRTAGNNYEDFAAKANHYDELVETGVI